MFSVFLGKYLEEEHLDHVSGIYLAFKETSKLFSKVIVPFYTLAIRAQKVSCSTSSPTLGMVRFSNFGFSNRCVVASCCGFNLHFLMIKDDEHIFMCLFGIHVSSSMKFLFKFFSFFFFWFPYC